MSLPCRRTEPARPDAGFTLVEVMVGIAIFTVLMGLLTGLVIDMLKTSSGTSARLTNVDGLRVGLDGVTKGLRTAVRPEQLNPGCTSACDSAFLSSSASAVTFYANYGSPGKAQLTTYRVEENLPTAPGTGRLVEEIHAAATPGGTPSTACAAGCKQRTLVRGLTWPVAAAAPVFDFADSGCSDFLTPVALGDIACVLVDLPVDGARDNPGTSATSTVFLPNSVMGR